MCVCVCVCVCVPKGTNFVSVVELIGEELCLLYGAHLGSYIRDPYSVYLRACNEPKSDPQTRADIHHRP